MLLKIIADSVNIYMSNVGTHLTLDLVLAAMPCNLAPIQLFKSMGQKVQKLSTVTRS